LQGSAEDTPLKTLTEHAKNLGALITIEKEKPWQPTKYQQCRKQEATYNG
jgi:hypothetical protein